VAVASVALLARDDLGEDHGGQVFARVTLDHRDVSAVPDETGDVLERDVPPRVSVVELAVGVLLDQVVVGFV
jgi:hypothetical protein